MSSEFPPDAVVIRFASSTPYWPLSMSYGVFHCPMLRRSFHSLDQYLAFRMLARPEDRARIAKTPNGYLAHNNLLAILESSQSYATDPVIVEGWEESVSDLAMIRGLELKFTQSAMLTDILLRTNDRPIYDDSRSDESNWCWCGGMGKNRHAVKMMELRDKLRSGEILPMVARSSSRTPG